jgi:hypothetical protein
MNQMNTLFQYTHAQSHEEAILLSSTNPNEPMAQYFYEVICTQPVMPPQWMI